MNRRDLLKLALELVSIMIAASPLLVFLASKSLPVTIASTPISASLLAISLVIMRFVEIEMFEIMRRMRKGNVWLGK